MVATKTKISFLALLCFCVYPTYFMWPLIGTNTNSHLVSGLTDVDGGIQLTQVLKTLQFPWSLNFYTDFPTGASIWRIQNFSQGIMIVFLWLATRILSAPAAISTFVYLGWVATGFVAYLLAMKYGVQRAESIFCGIAVQFLPFFRTNAGHYITYVWIAVPLLLILLLTDFAHKPRRKGALVVVVFLLSTAFFDGYWFYFSLIIGLIFCLFHVGKVRNHFFSLSLKNQVAYYWAPILAAVTGYVFFLLWITQTGAQSSSSRPISITNIDTIRNSAGKLADYVNRPWTTTLGGESYLHRPIGYVGIFVAFFAIVGITSCVYRRKNLFLVATTFSLMSLTIAPELLIFSKMIPMPSGLVRFIAPGLQYPVRAALIVECLLVVLASMGISEMRKNLGSNRLSVKSMILVIFLAASLDLNPSADRIFSAEYDKYKTIRQILGNDPGAVVMAAPENKIGRSWHEQWMMNVPFGNSLYNRQTFQEFDRQAGNGEASLAAYLNKSGINYLYTYASEDKQEFGFPLNTKRFRKLATVTSFGYEEGPTIMALYKVSSFPGDTTCSTCKAVTRVETNRNLVSDDGGFSYWNTGSTAQIKGYLSGPFNSWRDLDGTYELSFDVYSLNNQTLSVKDLHGYSRIGVEANVGYRVVRIFNLEEAIEIVAEKKCAIPKELIQGSKDPRGLCFNVANIKISRVGD